MATYPHDRFDDVPTHLERVGAHRAPYRRGRGWRTFGWSALATGVLVAGGAIGISLIDSGNTFEDTAPPVSPAAPTLPEPSVAASTPPAPVIDETLLVTVLNGTNTTGLAAAVADVLAEDGWQIGSRANASERDIATSTVYYWAAENEAAALGLAESLGQAEVMLSESFAPEEGEDPTGVAALTAVIGTDYAPPA